MTSGNTRSLVTLTGGTQAERRRCVLDVVASLVEASNYAMFGLLADADCVRYDQLVALGTGRDIWPRASGSVFKGPWDPVRVANRQAGRFVAATEPLAASVRRSFYEPLDLGNDLRMLVYDGDRFVAWVGAVRERGAPAFVRTEVARLNAQRERIASLALAAAVHDRLPLPSDDPLEAHLVLRPDGRVEMATHAAEKLLSPTLREELTRATHSLGEGVPPVFVHRDWLIRMVRMDGGDGERFLCSLRLARPVHSPLVRLTESQWRVADCVAAGATVTETAFHLGISTYTVKQHLKAIYSRLEVGARVELAEIVRSADRFRASESIEA